MQTCHVCGRSLDEPSLAAERCPHCGTIVRRLSQRTIEDPRLLHDQNRDDDKDGPDAGSDPSSQVTRLVNPGDLGAAGATLEFNQSDTAADASGQTDGGSADDTGSASADSRTAGSASAESGAGDQSGGGSARTPNAGSPGRKTPTVGDESDRTIEYQPPDDSKGDSDGDSEDDKEASRRSTHTIEKDLTIDFTISPDDVAHLDSQWRDTFDLDAKQSQTIRQKETVTGFRSSLPVKSRYIREKRKGGPAPLHTPAEVPDYELLDIIGEGGMGVVYAAHQSSIARTVAVKMLKRSAKVREEQRDKFISEAVVTGELDHPNIVPIYDLGANDEGALFYSMKRVRGTPWDHVIHKKGLDENLSILLRVADAVAFAHAGGVIHRDLKPENVMLGDFGEVLVMDWGLARVTPEFAHVDTVFQADSLGGTPAYMAPEMTRGPIQNINKTSDVYLLGALLYEIIGGQPPHSGRDVMQCLMAASQNRIDPIRYEGELKEIALRAMATRQEDRYQSVKEFQEAIRTYQSHSESLVLTAHANQNLQKARESGDYQLFARALYGFQEALTLWSDNKRAGSLLTETQYDYARHAFESGDFDLAASLLNPEHADHQALLTQIDAARAERGTRQRRLRRAKQSVAALVAAVVVVISVALVFVNAARNRAVIAQQLEAAAKEEANQKRIEAERAKAQEALAKEDAIQKRIEAERAKEQEALAKEDAIQKRREAELAKEQEAAAKEREEYEAYVAGIGLAAAKINDNAYDFAKDLLARTNPQMRHWEWGRLTHLANLEKGTIPYSAPVEAVAYSPGGQSIVSGDMAGKVTVRDAETGNVRFEKSHGQYVYSVAYSPKGRLIASGSEDGTIKILDAASGRLLRTLTGHSKGVTTVSFSPDSRQLLSGSYDNTARIWDIAAAQEVDRFLGHSWWVWAAEFSHDANRIVTAGQDGKAIVWQRTGARPSATTAEQVENQPARITSANGLFEQLTHFNGHTGPVYAANFEPHGDLVATGGYDHYVLLWDPDEVHPIDIERELSDEPQPESEYVRLAGHDKPVRSVAFSPNGKLVLSGSEDNTIRVWDRAAARQLKALRGHGSAVRSCAFSPNGQFVLSASEDKTVRLWNVAGYEEVRVLHVTAFTGHDDAVLSARYSRDGQRIVTASRDRTASLWDAATGQPLQRFQEGHEFLVSGAAFLPDDPAGGAPRRLVTGAGDNSVRIWDLAAGTELKVLSPTGRIGAVAVSPDGAWLATGSPGTEVQLWNAQSGERAGELPGHIAAVAALAFSPTGNRLASGDDRGRLLLWKRDTATNRWTLERELDAHTGGITAVRFTPDGRRLLAASADRTCSQWNLETGEELRPLVLSHDDWVSSLDVSADGTRGLTTSGDGVARLWRLTDAVLLATVRSPGTPFNSAAFSPDGRTAVLTAAEDNRVWLWDVSAATAATNPTNGQFDANSSLLELFLDFNKVGGRVWDATFTPDGRHVLTIGGNDAQLWNVDTRESLIRYSPHGAVASAVVSPAGRLVATGSWDNSAKIWDVATGRAIRRLTGGHTGSINSVEFSPDGTELLTASDDGTARLWDVPSGRPKDVVFRGHTARVIAATYSSDAARVLTVSGDKTARIWDRLTGRELKVLPGHEWAVLCGQFSPVGERAITGSDDDTARIWDLTGNTEPIILQGHTAAITSVAFSPDGKRVLTGSQDNSAKLWDAATGKEILSLPGHTQEVTSVSFSPDGLNVLTASRDGTAIVWLADDWRTAAQP